MVVGFAVVVVGRREVEECVADGEVDADAAVVDVCSADVVDSFTSKCTKLFVSGVGSYDVSCEVLPSATVIYTSEAVAARSKIDSSIEHSYFIDRKYETVHLSFK